MTGGLRNNGTVQVQSAMARLLAAAIIFCLAGGLSAQGADRVTITVAGMNKQIYLPAVLAQRLGYFADEDLKVELLDSPTGIEAENELLAGGAQAVVGFYDHTIELQTKGKFVQAIVQFCLAPGEALIVSQNAESYTKVADLKGARIGVVGLGSSTEMLLRYLAARSGLTPGAYHPVPVGAGEDFIAAMETGKIGAGITTEPTISRMVKGGQARILVDLRTPDAVSAALGSVYPGAALYVQSSWLAAHRPVAQKLATAFVRTLRYIASHDAADLAALVPPDFWAGDKELYISSLRQGKSLFSVDGRMPEGGTATAVEVFRTLGADHGKVIDISRTYTDEFVKAAATAPAR